MNKKIAPFIVIGFLLVIAVIIALTSKSDPKYVWYPTLEEQGKEPYDFSVLRNLLSNSYQFKYLTQRTLVQDVKTNAESAKEAVYFYVGRYPYFEKKEGEHLVEFAKNGGTIFIMSNEVPDSLFLELIAEDDCHEYLCQQHIEKVISKTIRAKLNYQSPKESFSFSYRSSVKDTSGYYWSYISSSYFCDEADYPLAMAGYFIPSEFSASDDNSIRYPNFIRIKIGDGFLFWHCNPILFTNLYLSKKTGYAYMNQIFAHANGKLLYWDKGINKPGPGNFERPSPPDTKPPSSMEFIFRHESLTWAWMLLVVTTVLYLVFGAKRRQRRIPIIEANRNTSLEFVETIGRLYFQQQNHRIIFEKQMQLFLAHLRKRYHISARELNQELIQKVVLRSDVEFDIVNDIFETYEKLNTRLKDKEVEMSSETLGQFYLLIERFHQAEEARKNITNSN